MTHSRFMRNCPLDLVRGFIGGIIYREPQIASPDRKRTCMSENDKTKSPQDDWLNTFWNKPAELSQSIFGHFADNSRDAAAMNMDDVAIPKMTAEDAQHWGEVALKLQTLWVQFQAEQMSKPGAAQALMNPERWVALSDIWLKQMPLVEPQKLAKQQQQFWTENLALWQNILGQFGVNAGTAAMSGEGHMAPPQETELPRKDRRFADDQWRAHPASALIHQMYLLLAEHLSQMVEGISGLEEDKHEQLRFATSVILEAASPANFATSNPVVLERTLATRGDNLVAGMKHLLTDLRRGQLTHTDPDAFKLGENIANTPGKVVHETELFQLIQYTPTTKTVLKTPLLIFPPWINRFYILDLNAKKSFVRWALDQGISVFMVSWKSADASMSEIVWDDYVLGQIAAIDHVRDRLDVPSVHTIGYCVSGTTLAAGLALLTKRGEADKVKSATFFTAQVDFEKAGDLLNFIDDQQLASLEALSPDGYLDGRYMAAAFNMLRGKDLIWNYVVNNYLLGDDYPAFDLLHWNGDVTNLPAKWHQAYLRDLYRDNRLVKANSLSVDGTAIDLSLVETPSYIQAGREDHIAPAESVWRITDHFKGPTRFVLAGSGHIAGVVNPPGANKYQYWLNDSDPSSLDEFVHGATEHPGSWWPDWIEWLMAQAHEKVPATGKRKPGGKGDSTIEDAPGRYVMTR
jgi:polyhydroxyalkanoate synthase